MALNTSILNTRVLLYTLSLTIIFSISSFQASAHFGSKGPFGGTASCAATQDSIVYIGTLNGGVFESTTNELTAWRARPVGLTSGKITALTHSGSYLFAGTADSGVFIFNGYVGPDRYWVKTNSGLTNLKIKSLLAIDSITILAGTDGSGLFKTTNKGTGWTQVNSAALNNAVITGMVKAGSRIILTSLTGGAFASDDNGVTWTDFNDANTLNIGGTTALSYNNATNELILLNANGLYIASSANTTHSVSYTSAQTGLPSNTTVRNIANNGTSWYLATDKGVFTSAVNTINWSAVNTGLPGINITIVATAQNRLIAGVADEGLYKATAGVNSWTELNSNFNNPVTRTMTAGGDNLVVAVTNKGVLVSKDLATSYTLSNNGLTDSLHVNDIIVADFGLLAATQNGGVFSTADSGRTWMAINTGLPNLNIKKLFVATHHKYAIDADGNIFEAALHDSSSWTPMQEGLPAMVNPASMAFYAGKLILGTMGNGVYLRDQYHGNWEAANAGLTNMNVTAVAASGNKLFAGTLGSGVFVSDFETVNWTQTSAISVAHSSMIGLNGNNIQAMACFGGYVYASYKGGLVTTSDNGLTWIAGGNQFNLPSFTDVNKICFVNSRVFVPTENNAVYSNALSEIPPLHDTLIVSAETIELAASPDEANVISVTSNRSWTVSADQTWITLSDTSGSKNGEFLVAASPNTSSAPRTGTITVTAGAKIKTITVTQDGITGLNETAEQLSNLSVFPNPSNGTFTIGSTSSDVAIQSVSVYDLTGKLVHATAVQTGQFSPELTVNCTPGIYFIQLNTHKGTVSRKLIIQ